MIQQCPHPTTVRDCYRTFVSGINPANAIHQGGFSRSVGSQNVSDLAWIQNKVDPIQSYMAMKSKGNLINVYVHSTVELQQDYGLKLTNSLVFSKMVK